MRSSSESKPGRPLSPHLQIYKPQITSVLSITHRITGVALAIGLAVLVAWLAAIAGGPESYATFTSYSGSILGQLILLGISFAFFFHLCLGIRHLLWDAGFFLEIKEVYKTGYIAIGAAVILTLIIWLKVYGVWL